MHFIETGFPDLYICEPRVLGDHRGFFVETYNKRVFSEAGLEYDFVQDNHARSTAKGVLRGLHFQLPPHAQAKLVWVTVGAVLDVVVDLRTDSPTYGKSFSVELSAANFKRVLVPKGFAHGYQTLEDVVEFQYKVDDYYAPQADSGIFWNDPELAIDWPIPTPVLSEKDKKLPLLQDFVSPFRMES